MSGLGKICKVVSNPRHPSEEWFAYRDALALVLPPREPVETAIQVLEAIADERRQTQRRMIAALYWRAGEERMWLARETAARDADPCREADHKVAWRVTRVRAAKSTARIMHRAMEAAL